MRPNVFPVTNIWQMIVPNKQRMLTGDMSKTLCLGLNYLMDYILSFKMDFDL